jgi:hypothetical protein
MLHGEITLYSLLRHHFFQYSFLTLFGRLHDMNENNMGFVENIAVSGRGKGYGRKFFYAGLPDSGLIPASPAILKDRQACT